MTASHDYDQRLDEEPGGPSARPLSPLAGQNVGYHAKIPDPHEGDVGTTCRVCGEDCWPDRPCPFADEHPGAAARERGAA